MAEDKNGVVVYASWIKKFEELEDDEAGRLIKHFFRYVNDLNPVAPDRTTKLMFIDIEDTLKRDLIKWEKRAERSRENGNKGGRPSNKENPKKPTETQQVILEPKKPVNVNVNVSVNADEIIQSIIKFFNFTETANFDKMRDSGIFVKLLIHTGQISNFIVQFEAYKKIKMANPKFTHSFKNFIGTAKEQFLDGAWNSENWVAKVTLPKSTRSDFVF